MDETQFNPPSEQIAGDTLTSAKRLSTKRRTVMKDDMTRTLSSESRCDLIKSAAKRLSVTQTAIRLSLPTSADIEAEKSKGDTAAQATDALLSAKAKLKKAVMAVKMTLPTVRQLQAARNTRLIENAAGDTFDGLDVGTPDENTIQLAKSKLEVTETIVRQRLPTVDCIKAETSAAEMAAANLTAAKGKLKRTETNERQVMPTTADIETEKTVEQFAANMLTDGRKSLKRTSTVERGAMVKSCKECKVNASLDATFCAECGATL